MKYCITVIIVFSSFFVQATHFFGGEITWECTASGKYVFNVALYRECGIGGAGLPANVDVSGPQGIINCSLVGTPSDVSPSCWGTGLACIVSPKGTGAVARHLYKSVPITLNGSPPAAGWQFSYQQCCKPSSVVNISGTSNNTYLRALMYNSGNGICNNSSPSFNENPIYLMAGDSATFTIDVSRKNSSDSLYIDFANSWDDSLVLTTLGAGYTYTQPFPNTMSDSVNGLTTINHQTGIITTNFDTAVNGNYMYCVEVQQWRDGKLLSKIFKDNVAIYGYSTAQQPIYFQVTNNNYSFSNPDPNTYFFDLYEGDTLTFNLEASTTQSRPDFTITEMTFEANGLVLDTPFGGVSGYLSQALLIPIAPQANYTNAFINRVRFNWVTGAEHTHRGSQPHYINVKLRNDICPFPARNNKAFLVRVKSIVKAKDDSLRVCRYDSIKLMGSTKSGNFQWTSADATLSSQLAAPELVATNSQYYFLSDPQNPGFIDSVYVEVDTISPISLSSNGGALQISNNNINVIRTWFYNEIPFAYPYDTLTSFSGGLYQASIVKGRCKDFTDTLGLLNGANLAVTTIGNGNYRKEPVRALGSIGIQFRVNKNVNLTSLTIPGLINLNGQANDYNLNLKIYNHLQLEVHNQTVGVGSPFRELFRIRANVPLQANSTYTIALTGDSGYAFSVYENFSLPATPFNIGFTVLKATEGLPLGIPIQKSNFMLPLALGIDKGMEINKMDYSVFRLFPNPTKAEVQLVGLSNEAEKVELVNVNGQVISSMVVTANTKPLILNCTNVPSGVYMVRVHLSKGATVSRKLLIE